MTTEYVEFLWKNPEAFRYLDGRGFTPDDIWEYGLGYDPHWRGIVIPYFVRGVEIGARVRLLYPTTTAKYLPMNHFKAHLYNVDVLLDGPPHVYVTEGEFDCMILRKLGLTAVGVSGASAFKREWKYLFEHIDTVTLCMDPDDAGDKANNRIRAWIGDMCDDVRQLELPDGMDVNDAFLAGRLNEEALA